MRWWKAVCLLLACSVCDGCSVGAGGVDPRSLTLNPHPSQVIQVIAKLPDRYAVERLKVTYSTDSSLPTCNGLNFPDGGPFPLKSNIYVPTTREAGQIRASIQADKFVPGPCGWRLAAVYAVVEDAGRDISLPLVAIGYEWYQDHHLLGEQHQTGDMSTFYCGYRSRFFGCDDGPIGDVGYLPVELMGQESQLRFSIRDSGFRPPVGYHTPCRNDDGAPVTLVATAQSSLNAPAKCPSGTEARK